MKAGTDSARDKPVKSEPAPAPALVRRRLNPAAIRLLIVAVLFAGWMSYLAYLVATRPLTAEGVPLVLSRPQFLLSELDVIAEVDSTDSEVIIKDILYPKSDAPVKVEEKLHVDNLAQCRRTAAVDERPQDVPLDWTGPGLYLLALTKAEGTDHYQVVPTPPSPGYPPPTRERTPRIYPVSDPLLKRAALAQYDAIKKP